MSSTMMALTAPQRSRFAEDGFVVLRGAVAPERVRAAREAIGSALESDESIGEMPRFLADTFCASIVDSPAILALFDPIRPAIESLFGIDPAPRADVPQIALRFPQRARDGASAAFHLDGFPTGLNGVPGGTLFRQTLLAGVYLTPLRGPDRGNFVVWPGSHLFFARFFRALDVPRFLAEHGPEALLSRVRAEHPGPAQQLEVEIGDVVLAHHLLAHGAADNLSLRTREAVYCRFMHPADDVRDPAPLTDATRFFDGVDWSAC
ncbi:MAG: phytanoyl-CoA dioxygenase family protein [Myxococcota bacterium]|nr:phytanoyl-CoA dioxygenase family protein [Myxococcota bacterium]